MPASKPHPKTLARHAALRALMLLENEELPLAQALERSDVPAEMRAFAREIVAGVLRQRARLDYTLAPLLKKKLEKLDAPVRAALRLAAYESLFTSTPAPVAANEYAGLMRAEKMSSAVAFINAVARRLPVQPRPAPPFKTEPVAHLSIEYSHPAWLVERWLARFGFEETAKLCAANNRVAPLSLRVNTLHADRETVLKALQARGLKALPGALSPDCILVEEAGSPIEWPEWKAGAVIAQDEAAQLVALLAAPQAGATVIDLASAPGGKTTHLAQLMGDKGRIVACDRAAGRLKLVAENARRLGLKSVETCEADGRKPPASLPTADLVLLDAPCLGTGTLRRRPDAKWRKTPLQLKELVVLQRELLDSAANLVKPGGALVYSTCSLEPEENEEQVAAFLQRHPAWRLEAPNINPESDSSTGKAAWGQVVTPAGMIQTLPQRHDSDGMFAAKLRSPA